MAEEKLIGKITHFFSNISVAVLELENSLAVGDKIKIKGRGQEFEQAVDSMQVEHKNVEKAGKGESVGMKVAQKVKEGDLVYKV